MANIAICNPIISDAATIATDSEHANFPVTNLKKIQPAHIWRSNLVTSAYIELGPLTSTAFDLVSLICTNLTSTATWRIRTANSQANLTASPIHDSTAITFWPTTNLDDWESINGFYVIPSPSAVTWIRIDLVDSANPNGFLEASRIYVSKMWQPTVNMKYDWGIGYNDASIFDKTIGGNTLITPQGKIRVLNFDLDFEDEDEMFDNAFYLDRNRGESGDILVIPDYENSNRIHDQSVYGLSRALAPINNPRYQLFRKRYRVEELI